MKHLTKYTFCFTVFIVAFSACKTNKNTVVHRAYHNLTARFNGYYYATESIKEGETKIRTSFKYDYDKLLPVFLVPDNEKAKSTFPDFDKAIKKSSNCIQRHTIKDKKGNEIPSAGKWIDNNWNVIGISHFYKREFFSAIEAFEYVIRTYKSKDKYKAMIWLARSYNEIGAPSQAEPVIGLLKDDKKISKYAKGELPAVQAQYYIQRGMYSEAEQALLKALKLSSSKRAKARYAFILGQMHEERKENRKAIEYYKKTISLKPDYEMVFNARMREALLVDVKTGNVSKLKRDLQNMTRDLKNQEYLDVIYYTLGGIYEKEKNERMAIDNYKLSIKNSTQNPKQKALSYLKLGEINFENANYPLSGAYYDSTMITLPKDYINYDQISKRKTTLETLVGYITTIKREDSLQRIARMSDGERDRFITKMMERMAEEEERKKEERENLEAQNQNPAYAGSTPATGLPAISNGVKGNWYFYNQTTLSFGINDFVKKWGNRKLEDNWRRSQKGVTFDNSSTGAGSDSTEGSGSSAKAKKGKFISSNKNDKSYYEADLPLSDSALKKSNATIIDAYYNLASTYKEELNNNKKSIAAYEELNKRYADHKYRVSTYYQLYKIFLSVKNQSQADFYKNKLFNEYPNSEYTQIIKNPKYISEKTSQKGEVELYYTDTYNEYANGNYSKAYERAKESEIKYGKNEFSGKFAFIRAMCTGKLKGSDSLESALKQVQIFYPKDPVANQAQEILEILYNLKHPSDPANPMVNNTDTFTLDLKSQHFVVVVFPDDASVANPFKTALSDFNEKYYPSNKLAVTTSLFGPKDQIANIKTFKNAEEALKYIGNLKTDKLVFSGKVRPELFTIVAISADNLPRLYRKKQISYYKPFFDDHYKIIN